jgi:hypothetical protein
MKTKLEMPMFRVFETEIAEAVRYFSSRKLPAIMASMPEE